MQIQSLAYRTDLFFPQFDGIVLDRGPYLVIRTPANPNFYWGNYLLFAQPPAPGDLEIWQSLFEQEIRTQQETHHVTFGWDSPEGILGDIQPFLDVGFTADQSIVLTTAEVTPPRKYNTEVVIRPLMVDTDWAQALQNQVDCRGPVHSAESYLTFKKAAMARYRAMQHAGLGAWFGAFIGQQLVADLGVFCRDGIGRFQTVETAPAFRRQGICGTLVYQAACFAFDRFVAKTLVMVADEDYHAAGIYESVGFRAQERQVGLERW